MDRIFSNKFEPGLYSTSMINIDTSDSQTFYRPLRKPISAHELTIDSPTAYNYRSRTNTSIIERRFSSVEPTISPFDQFCE